ncbi:hypothetical protein LJX78_00205 [Methanimicrococcus blatticola]|uniref:hypothetical protein n=1 Tax=Methanimicrococcus blatticola TaxID=91560 RepID=UPI001E62596D|nr:hypothetical protein [Methanimicrococcus blatticola]MCC2508038.1 hypothetical protein [Methanimicrococcus blatticola]
MHLLFFITSVRLRERDCRHLPPLFLPLSPSDSHRKQNCCHRAICITFHNITKTRNKVCKLKKEKENTISIN